MTLVEYRRLTLYQQATSNLSRKNFCIGHVVVIEKGLLLMVTKKSVFSFSKLHVGRCSYASLHFIRSHVLQVLHLGAPKRPKLLD